MECMTTGREAVVRVFVACIWTVLCEQAENLLLEAVHARREAGEHLVHHVHMCLACTHARQRADALAHASQWPSDATAGCQSTKRACLGAGSHSWCSTCSALLYLWSAQLFSKLVPATRATHVLDAAAKRRVATAPYGLRWTYLVVG